MLKLGNFSQSLTRSVSRGGLVLQKHSPTILTAAGVVGVVAAGIIASRATLKLEEIMDRKREALSTSKELFENQTAEEPYSESDHKQDVAKIYIRTSGELVRLYGPAISLGVASIGCIVTAHGIMRKRNAALAAAVKAVETAFSSYRKTVAEKLGEEGELEIRRDIREIEVESDEEGKKPGKVVTPGIGNSPYARLFDHRSSRWQTDAEYNAFFLQSQETIFNQILHAKGHLFLNDVYEALDLPISKEGQVVGWLSDGTGDQYVSFGIFEDYFKTKGENFNNYDRVIYLDFNVDGEILSKI